MLTPQTGSGGYRLGRNIIYVIERERVVAGGRDAEWPLRGRRVVATRPASARCACVYWCCAPTGKPAPLAEGSRSGVSGFFPLRLVYLAWFRRLAPHLPLPNDRLKAIPDAEDVAYFHRNALVPFP